MAIPDFQTMMLPLLELTDDGKIRSLAESRPLIADHFKLTPEERKERLPSGQQTILANRVAWASIYMERAKVLQRPERGHYQITDRGRSILESKPEKIGIKFLQQFPEFTEWQKKKPDKPGGGGKPPLETPLEALENAYQQLRSDLAQEVVEKVMTCSPQFFERLVVDLLVSMGYGGSRTDAAKAVGQAGDEGIDGIIQEDLLGLDVIYLQAKRWQGPVGRPEIQKFVGALHGKHARKGVFITTSTFSTGAAAYASTIDSKVVLIDGERLADLMIDHNLGVGGDSTYEVKRLDIDYFAED